MRYILRHILLSLVLILLTSCTSPAVNQCYQDCLNRAQLDSQMIKDVCKESCEQMEYAIGEKGLAQYNNQLREEQNKKDYAIKDSVSIPKENVTQAFSSDITKCKNIYADYRAEWATLMQNTYDLDKDTKLIDEDCENEDAIIAWSRESPKTPYQGPGRYIDQKNSLEAKNTYYERCIPLELKYKTAVYTKRNELDQHTLPDEAVSDCMIMLNLWADTQREDALTKIEEDLPNW